MRRQTARDPTSSGLDINGREEERTTYEKPAWAREFYDSVQWKHVRSAYMKKVAGLCEECLKVGVITPAVDVHHVVKLTEKNVNDPNISLSFGNLQALCREHHAAKHKRSRDHARYDVDPITGKVTTKEDTQGSAEKNSGTGKS